MRFASARRAAHEPETGTLHPIAEDAAAAAQQIASGEIGKDWPTFEVGEIVDIRGYKFTITRINMGSIVVRPVHAKGLESPRNLMRKMTERGT